MTARVLPCLLACLFLCLPATAAMAEAEVYRLRYTASLLGLPIGRADFTSRLEDGRFTVEGRFASAGLARLFERTDGTVSVRGRLNEARVVPARYDLDYTSGEERATTSIRFSGGRVAEVTVTPEPEKRGKDWVAVKKKHLKGAKDPLSALLEPVSAADEVCNRRFEVFDGEMRADLVLGPAGAGERLGEGLTTCRVRFVPVAGYREGRSTIAFLRDEARILVAFRPLGAEGQYTLVKARIGTKIGPVHISGRPLE